MTGKRFSHDIKPDEDQIAKFGYFGDNFGG
jgi:hypothetical protein